LDLGRGLAALAVVIFHYCYINDSVRLSVDWLQPIAVYGYLGVHFFFVLSGFVIFMTLERTHGAFDFAFARAARLYPSYVLSIGLTLVVFWLLTGESAVSTMDALLNLTMFAELFGAEKVNPAYWTLSREIIFYGLIFLILRVRRGRYMSAFLITWIAISALHYVFPLGLLERAMILKWAPLFVAGAALYKAKVSTRKLRLRWAGLYILSLPLACLYASEALSAQAEFFDFWSADKSVVITLITLIYVYLGFAAFRRGMWSWVPPRVVEIVGGSSYLLYLIHETVGMVLIDRWFSRLGLASVFCVIAIMVAVSILLFLYFEVPVQRALKSMRTHIFTRRVASLNDGLRRSSTAMVS